MFKYFIVFSTFIPTLCFAISDETRIKNLESSVIYLDNKIIQTTTALSNNISDSHYALNILKADSRYVPLFEDEISELKERKLNTIDFENEHYDRIDAENYLHDKKADKEDLNKIKDNIDDVNNNIKYVSSISNTYKKDIENLNNKINQNSNLITDQANSYTDFRFENLSNHMKKIEKESRSGISSAIAIANIPTTQNIGKFNLGIGVGNFKDSSSLAIGSSYRFNESITTKFSLANSNDTTSFGAGMSYDF